MSEISWIKLKTGMFDNQKIKLIEALPEADTLIVIWIKLLTAAGKVNCSGYIMITEKIPMGVEEMATIFNRPLNTVRLAIETFKRYGMIEVEENQVIRIANWDKHQNIEGMERVKAQTAERVRKHREKKKQLELILPSNVTCNVTETLSNATESESELDLEKELESDIEKEHQHQESNSSSFTNDNEDDGNLKIIANKFLSLKTELDNKKAILRQKDLEAIKRVQALNLSTTKITKLIEDCFTIFKLNQEGSISSFSYIETFINNEIKNVKKTSKKIIRKEIVPDFMANSQQEHTSQQEQTKELSQEEKEKLQELLRNLKIKKPV